MKCETENPLASALEAAEVMNRTGKKIQTTDSLVELIRSKVLLYAMTSIMPSMLQASINQHNSLADFLLFRFVKEGMVSVSTDGVFQSE